MFKLDLESDRLPRPQPRDPVAGRTGVFGVIERAELSPAEAARWDPPAAEVSADPPKIWTPKGLWDRMTRLYQSLGRPQSVAAPAVPKPAPIKRDTTKRDIKNRDTIKTPTKESR